MLTKEELDAKGFARGILLYGIRFYSDPENVKRFEEWKRSRRGVQK